MDSYVPATNTVSFGAAVFRFSWIYVLAAIAVVVIAFLLEAFLHIDMSKNSFLGVLPLMTAGSGTGKYYATRTGTKPRGGKAWLIALVGLVISLAFNLAVVLGFVALTDSWQGWAVSALSACAAKSNGWYPWCSVGCSCSLSP